MSGLGVSTVHDEPRAEAPGAPALPPKRVGRLELAPAPRGFSWDLLGENPCPKGCGFKLTA